MLDTNVWRQWLLYHVLNKCESSAKKGKDPLEKEFISANKRLNNEERNLRIDYCGEGNDFGGRVTVHEAPFSEFVKDSKHCLVVWFDAGKTVRLQQATTFLWSGSNAYYENSNYRKKQSVRTL